MPSAEPKPVEIRKIRKPDPLAIVGSEPPSEIRVTWSDGHVSVFPNKYLRLQCPCATCIDEWTREVRVDPEKIPDDIHSKEISAVGRYAIQIAWSDGHDTGLYTFRNLRSLCPCPECKQQ